MTEPVRGLELDAVKRWLALHVEGADAELAFELVAAGGSNLTYRVESANGQRWALRRPPVRARVATAHDMGREWRILRALHDHAEAGVPVPTPVAFCDDASVTGAPFYVMGFAEGAILRGPEDAQGMTTAQCRAATESLIEVQVALHTLDVDAVGLGKLGRREAYVERQLARWLKQYRAVQSRELPLVDELHAVLAKRIPKQRRTGLVHGDYRFDNTVLDVDFRVGAVLDWELCTLGDPLADLGYVMNNWAEAGELSDAAASDAMAPTAAEGFPTRREFLDRYAERTGRDVSGVDYYRAFQYWRLAAIVEGVLARYQKGVMGADADTSAFRRRVDLLAGQAVARVREVSG